MFKNVSTKNKLLINLILTQIAFAILSITAIFSTSKVTAVITVNIIFGIIIAYTMFSAMNRIVGGIERFKEYLHDLMDFALMRKNSVRKAQYIKNDEIGLILHEMNSYYDKFEDLRNNDMKVLGEIVLVLSKVEQGIFGCRVNSDSNNFMIKALKDTLNRMLNILDHNIEDIRKTAALYSQGNYSQQLNIDENMKEQLLSLMQSINTLGTTLNDNAKMNLNNGQELENNSKIMRNSMQNLATKANEQAASLEQTAASVEEITSITRNNANNAVKMSELGQLVQKSVLQGEEQANQTAKSMEEINDKVSQINESIEVIDQIAFQTNILSLNAAVEAATAGEAGKGFAVVAQEVRNLASRSAEAAKEIKELVQNANEKTAEGKSISDNMIDGYKKLNNNMTETIKIIDDVSSSSKEQILGIEQINDVINMLDKVTQENANEASQISEIANDVSTMAHELVESAQNKIL